MFTYRIPWVHLTINYCVDKLYLFTFDKSVYVNHFHPFSLLSKQHALLSIWLGLLSQMNFQIKAFTSFLYFSGTTSFHYVTCQITMSDLMLHEHICLLITLLTPWCIANTPGVLQITMSDVMINTHTHILLITLLQPCCMSHHYDRFNDECTHMFYWWHYLHHVVCQINMSWWMYTHVLLIALLTSYSMSDQYVRCNDEHIHIFTDDTTNTMVHVRSLCQI